MSTSPNNFDFGDEMRKINEAKNYVLDQLAAEVAAKVLSRANNHIKRVADAGESIEHYLLGRQLDDFIGGSDFELLVRRLQNLDERYDDFSSLVTSHLAMPALGLYFCRLGQTKGLTFLFLRIKSN